MAPRPKPQQQQQQEEESSLFGGEEQVYRFSPLEIMDYSDEESQEHSPLFCFQAPATKEQDSLCFFEDEPHDDNMNEEQDPLVFGSLAKFALPEHDQSCQNDFEIAKRMAAEWGLLAATASPTMAPTAAPASIKDKACGVIAFVVILTGWAALATFAIQQSNAGSSSTCPALPFDLDAVLQKHSVSDSSSLCLPNVDDCRCQSPFLEEPAALEQFTADLSSSSQPADVVFLGTSLKPTSLPSSLQKAVFVGDENDTIASILQKSPIQQREEQEGSSSKKRTTNKPPKRWYISLGATDLLEGHCSLDVIQAGLVQLIQGLQQQPGDEEETIVVLQAVVVSDTTGNHTNEVVLANDLNQRLACLVDQYSWGDDDQQQAPPQVRVEFFHPAPQQQAEAAAAQEDDDFFLDVSAGGSAVAKTKAQSSSTVVTALTKEEIHQAIVDKVLGMV